MQETMKIEVSYTPSTGIHHVIHNMRIDQDEFTMPGMTLAQLQSYMQQLGWQLAAAHLPSPGTGKWAAYNFVREQHKEC
jgi:hypothetical protein